MVTPVGSLLPPEQRPFGKYELVAKLATGGMAEIFLARQRAPRSPEPLVIKRVLPHLAEDERFVAMFRDEARLASRISHHNVCRVIEAGTVGHTYFIAMEYLHGVPLSRMLLRAARLKEPLDVRLVAGIIMQSCDGLHHAHELTTHDGKALGVVHRDVSPPNIFVTSEGQVRLLDFGVAKARGASQRTRTGTVKGKNSYMSPEQILTRDVDRRSDIFSLGVVTWECLTARRLFSRDSDFMTFRAITEDPIPGPGQLRADVSNSVDQVVHKALARDAADRYATAREYRDALEGAMEEYGGAMSPQQVAEFVCDAYREELGRMKSLIANMSGQFEAIDGESDILEMEVQEVEVEVDERGEPIEPAEGAAPTGARHLTQTGTDQIADYAAIQRRRLLLAIVTVAATAAVLVAFLLTRSSDRPEPSATQESSGAAVRRDAAAAIDATHSPPVDAGAAEITDAPPDAAPEPEVDLRPGYLTVDATPYATIFIDGKEIGVTPIFKHKLSPGSHKLKAVSATGEKKRVRVRIKPGRTKNLGRLTWGD